MKRVILILLILLMILPIASCGKSEEVKNVESLISSIGTVTENSQASINTARDAYEALSAEDKGKVKNYDALLNAQSAYVENIISSIGAVNKNSEKTILWAERAYEALSVEARNKVKNYNTLLDARKAFDALPKELSSSNINEYLSIDLSYGEYENHSLLGYGYRTLDVYLKTYPVAPVSFQNVEITVEISCPIAWETRSSDSAYNEADDSTMKFTIKLPADGKYEEVHGITEFPGVSVANGKNCSLKIVSVQGAAKQN